MDRHNFRPLGAIVSAILCISCTHELREVNSAYDKNIIGGDIKSVEFIIPSFVDEGQDIQTKTVLTSQGFVWAEKDTVGIFPSKGNQIYYEMSSGAGSSSAVFDGGGWALKDEYIYSSYYPLKGDFYLDRKSIPVTYSTEVTQCGNNNSEHLGANAFMFAPETTVSNGKVTFKYWQLGSVLKPRVTLPAGTYTKLVLSTEAPIFVVSGKYDLTTGVDASSPSATMPDFVPVIVPNEDKSGNQSLTNCLSINLEDVTFAAETELVAYIMAAPVDVSNIPITVTIYSGDSPKYRYEYVRTSSFVAQTNHNIRPNEKGLMTVANNTESANAAFVAGETSLSLVGVEDNSVFDLVLPATAEPVNISMEANEGKCTMNVSYPHGQISPEELNIIASNGSEIVLKTPTSTVTLDGDREYTSVRASTASNTLIVNENITIGTLYLEKGNVKVYGEIMALNTDDLEEGEHPTLFVYGDIQGQIDDDDVIVRKPITAVSLDKSTLELKPGDIVQLNFTTEPQNAIFENVTWSSSDGNVATVAEDGTVTAISAGECLITVDIDGKQATCMIIVTDLQSIISLSANGPANCYIIPQKGTYKFEAVQGNSYTPVGDVKGVKVLWETFGTTVVPSVAELIKPDITYADNFITFSTNDNYKKGNAVIAAYSDANCSEGNVLWSWHIWLTDRPGDIVHANNSGILMDRNLGATSAGPNDGSKTYGLLYQWGRKDPFIGSSTSPASSILAKTTITWPKVICPDNGSAEYDLVPNSGSIEYATKHPTTLIYRYSGRDWEEQESFRKWVPYTKTKYDPCPPGYRVPSISVWNSAGFPDHNKICDEQSEYGVTIGEPYCASNSWYPGAGAYLFSYKIGWYGDSYLWSSDGSDGWGKSYYTSHSSLGTNGYWGTFEMYSALSVRCCKDENYGKVSSFAVDEKCTSVMKGATKQLTWTIKPDVFQDAEIIWSSGNPNVATVSQKGLITGVSEGEAVITASVDGITENIYLLVGDYPKGDIVFADDECKSVCVSCWDKDGDKELSYVEAGHVKEISTEFLWRHASIKSFDEFQYFVNCKSLTSYKHKSDGDYYADGVFEGMSDMVSITLPNGLITIGENCFSGCHSLKSITIPSSVSDMGYACFEYCRNLQTVMINATTPPTLHYYDTYYEVTRDDPHTFKDAPCKIYVPNSVLTQYNTSKDWSFYADKIYGW